MEGSIALMSKSQVLVLAVPLHCCGTSDKSPTCRVGTAKKEALMYRAPNTAKELHTDFSHLSCTATLFIKEVMLWTQTQV